MCLKITILILFLLICSARMFFNSVFCTNWGQQEQDTFVISLRPSFYLNQLVVLCPSFREHKKKKKSLLSF